MFRACLGMTRREVEVASGGEILASSLSSFENNQSKISISYLSKMISFYKSKGIVIDFEWLFTGVGFEPMQCIDINSNINVIKEASFFKDLNKSSILYTVDNNDFSPFINIGDVLGGVKCEKKHSGIKIVNTVNLGLLLVNAYVDCECITYNTSREQNIKRLDYSVVVGVYDVVWIRKTI